MARKPKVLPPQAWLEPRVNVARVLSLLAFNAFERQNYREAIGAWDMMLKILPANDQRRAVIERIRQTLADSMVLEGGAEIRITGSFGLVTSPGANATPDLDELFKAADLALYAAKAAGRNRALLAAV